MRSGQEWRSASWKSHAHDDGMPIPAGALTVADMEALFKPVPFGSTGYESPLSQVTIPSSLPVWDLFRNVDEERQNNTLQVRRPSTSPNLHLMKPSAATVYLRAGIVARLNKHRDWCQRIVVFLAMEFGHYQHRFIRLPSTQEDHLPASASGQSNPLWPCASLSCADLAPMVYCMECMFCSCVQAANNGTQGLTPCMPCAEVGVCSAYAKAQQAGWQHGAARFHGTGSPEAVVQRPQKGT